MIDRAIWLGQMRGAILADCQQPRRQIGLSIGLDAFKTLAQSNRDGSRLALSGQFRQLAGEPMSLVVLDIHAHDATILPFICSSIPSPCDERP